METYIAILRGINVGGHKAIKMELLRKLCEELGFTKVKTYIQSGNIVFQAENLVYKTLEEKIGSKIKQTFGFEVPVLIKTKLELEQIIAQNQLLEGHDETFLHVTFLAEIPSKANVDKIIGPFANDKFLISASAVYLYCPDSYSSSKLSNTFLEAKLKVTATTRNWKTVKELAKIALEVSQ